MLNFFQKRRQRAICRDFVDFPCIANNIIFMRSLSKLEVVRREFLIYNCRSVEISFVIIRFSVRGIFYQTYITDGMSIKKREKERSSQRICKVLLFPCIDVPTIRNELSSQSLTLAMTSMKKTMNFFLYPFTPSLTFALILFRFCLDTHLCCVNRFSSCLDFKCARMLENYIDLT